MIRKEAKFDLQEVMEMNQEDLALSCAVNIRKQVAEQEYKISLDPNIVDEPLVITFKDEGLNQEVAYEIKSRLEEIQEKLSCGAFDERYAEIYWDDEEYYCETRLADYIGFSNLADALEYEDGVVQLQVYFWLKDQKVEYYRNKGWLIDCIIPLDKIRYEYYYENIY